MNHPENNDVVVGSALLNSPNLIASSANQLGGHTAGHHYPSNGRRTERSIGTSWVSSFRRSRRSRSWHSPRASPARTWELSPRCRSTCRPSARSPPRASAGSGTSPPSSPCSAPPVLCTRASHARRTRGSSPRAHSWRSSRRDRWIHLPSRPSSPPRSSLARAARCPPRRSRYSRW